jgi:hypothetical protein
MVVLLNENKIIFVDDINVETANQFQHFFSLAMSTNHDCIELHISSGGGKINAANQIIDCIQLSYKPVHAYIHNGVSENGYPGVASAAAVIVSYCSFISMDDDAIFMIHHARSPNNQILKDELDIIFWMEKTNFDYETIKMCLETEKKCIASEALFFNFIHAIDTSSSFQTLFFSSLDHQVQYNNEIMA